MREREKSIQFWFESLEGKNHAKDLGVDGRIILTLIIRLEGVDWIHLARGRE
jgi:hypothetical protein